VCVVVIPPYGSMGVFSLLCVCTVRPTDFSAAKKDRRVKFRARVRLLSGQVFVHFGELWLAGSHRRRHYFGDEL